MKRNFKAEIAELIRRLKNEHLTYYERQMLEDEVIRLGKLDMKFNRKKHT